jgi:hypothetical protein
VIGLDLKETLPVSGGKGVTLYQWKTSSGKVWKYFGDNDFHTKYKGEVKKGLPNGLGIKIYPIRESVKIKYKSEYRTTQYLIKYIGSFKNGKEWNGKGYNMHEDFIVEYVNGKFIPQ